MNKFLYCYVALALLFCLFHHPAFSQDKQPLDTARTEEKTRDVNPFNPDQYHYISWQDNMMGASPEAAKMTRYADTPVSYAYGLAEIGLPIYTIQSRSLQLPITLSYDSSGIKPEEISGIVGLGWSLQAGGVITRTIIGRVDDGSEIPTASTNESDAESLAIRANNAGYDTEYDRYTYNFCGHSGSFYKIPWQGIVPTEPTELLISGTGPFTITDKDGTQYIFGQAETSTRYMGSNIIATLHTHIGTIQDHGASGYKAPTKVINDRTNIINLHNSLSNKGLLTPEHFVYEVSNSRIYKYTPWKGDIVYGTYSKKNLSKALSVWNARTKLF